MQTDIQPLGATKNDTKEDRAETRAIHTGNTNQETRGEDHNLLTETPTGNRERGHLGLAMNGLLPDILTVVTEVASQITVVTEVASQITVVTEAASQITVVTEAASQITVATEVASQITVATEVASQITVVTEVTNRIEEET